MPQLSDERLSELCNEAGLVAEICEREGEMDGFAAAQAQHRALTKEIEQRARG